MKSVLSAVFVFLCGCVTAQAQSCITPDDIKQMLARILAAPAVPAPTQPAPPAQPEAAPPPTLDKKLLAELVKMAEKQRDLLQQVVSEDQTKQSDREKLHK